MARHAFPLARLADWYGGSLANRIQVQAQAMIMVVALLFGTACYLIVDRMLTRSIENELEVGLRLNRQRLEDSLERRLGELEALSRRNLVQQALSPRTSPAALLAFLVEYRGGDGEISALALHDAQGRPLAASGQGGEVSASLLDTLEDGQPRLRLLRHLDRPGLQILFPVRLPGSADGHGVLRAEIDLGVLCRRLFDDQGGLLVLQLQGPGEEPLFRQGLLGGPGLHREAALLGRSALLQEAGLQLQVSRSAAQLLRELEHLNQAVLLLATLFSLLTYFLARHVAQRLIKPLTGLAQLAQEVTTAGPERLRRLPVDGPDEVGLMAHAFNGMVGALQDAYAHLEQRVRSRTAELEAAKARLAHVLDASDDGIYSLDAENGRVLYLSPAMARIGGCDLHYFFEYPNAWSGLVLADDRLAYTQALQGLRDNGSMSLRYRLCRPDGSVRWICDRARLLSGPEGEARIDGRVIDVSEQVASEAARTRAEESLRLREQALQCSANGVVIADMRQPGAPIIYANPAFERITGYTAAEVIGRNCRFLQGEDHDQPGIACLARAIRGGEECTVTLRNYRKDGSLFWNQLSVSPIRGEDGRITHCVGVQQDISEQMESTRALAESEHRLTLTFDAINDGVWDYFVPSGRFYTSPSWARLLGYPMGEHGAGSLETLWACIPESDRDRVRNALEDHLRGETDTYQCQHPLRQKDGSEIWVANRGRVVEWDAAGKPVRMVGTITDVTDRYRAEQQLMEWNLRMESIFTLSPDGFVYFDRNRRVEYVNAAFERMTGLLCGTVTGLTICELEAAFNEHLDPGAPPAGYREALERVAAGEEWEPDAHLPLIHLASPQRRVLSYQARLDQSDGSLVLYLRDVTRESEVDRMKSEFLSTAAHELRTPMASIMGFSELLLRRNYNPDVARECLETIHRQSKRLTNLLNELLDLARIEARAGKDFKLKLQGVNDIVTDTVSALIVDDDRPAPHVHLLEGLPQVNVDGAKLQQAVMNVLSNAYKYSPSGGVVEVATLGRSSRSGHNEVGVQITDHGLGMTPEQVGRVFERFYRADPSGNIPGTGLGMSLVKEIIEQHRGHVEISSEFGKGTTVCLWLPAA
ncbi:MAG: hypothetical protein RIR00_931 [Pseudomonadota bacterium]|jgi:PAS domain S-box-containing protein